MLMAFLMFANGGNSSQEKLNYIINIYFKYLKKLDKGYNHLKD